MFLLYLLNISNLFESVQYDDDNHGLEFSIGNAIDFKAMEYSSLVSSDL